MAEVAVFVDDAVLGRLAQVCTKRGTPTCSRLRVVEEVGRTNRLGILWLLVLAGPLGWVVLLVLSSRDVGERLTVELPFSDAAYAELVAARSLRNRALACGLAVTVALLLLTGWAQLGSAGLVLAALAGLATVAGTVLAEWRIGRGSVGVSLDASRRWVTLDGVHPDFAAACRERQLRHVADA